MAGLYDPNTLLVLPAFDHVEAILVGRARGDGYADPERVLTFSGLVDRLAAWALAQAPPGAWWYERRLASATELVVLRRQLLAEARTRATPELAPLLGGRVSELFARFADECGEGAVTEAELAAFVADEGDEEPRLALLSELFARYRGALDARAWLDASDRLRVARDSLARRRFPLAPVLRGVRSVEVRDQYDWSALRLALLEQLAQRLTDELGPPERLRLAIPYSHESQHLFHHLEPSLRELENRAEAPIDVVFEALEDARPGAPAQIAAALFSDAAVVDLRAPAGEGSTAPPTAPLRLLACPTEPLELRAIAREVRRLLDRGVAPDRVAVALRSPEPGWRDVARAFDAYGIPWHYRRGPLLADTPLLRYVADLLTAVIEDLPREALERVLTSAFTPTAIALDDGPDAADETEDPDGEAPRPRSLTVDHRLVALLRAAGVRDRRTGALDGRHGYAVRLEAYLRRLAPVAPVDGDPRAAARYAAQQRAHSERVEEARALLARVDQLAALTEARPLDTWAESLARLFATPGFDPTPTLTASPFEHPEGARPSTLEQAAVAALAVNQQAWSALQQLLGDLARTHGAVELRLTTAGFRSVLLEAARQLSLNPPGGRGAAVRIVPVRQLVGADLDHVFLPQLNEGRFPRSSRSDPLFRDADRLAFEHWRRRRARGKPVYSAFRVEEAPPEGERVPVRRSEEVVLFCLALAAARHSAVVSWSCADATGRPLLPSLFVDALRRLRRRSGEPAAALELEPLEMVPSLERALAPAEITALAARGADVDVVGPNEPAWLVACEHLAGPERSASLVRRVRVERARALFFEALDRSERPRLSLPEGVPPELGPWLGFIAPTAGTWIGRGRFPFDAARPASSSRLDRYAQCPAQFFFSDVLRVRPDDEVAEEMDVLSRGLVAHRSVERFFEALAVGGLGGVEAVRGRRADEARALLEDAVVGATADLAETVPLGHPRLLGVQRRKLADMLWNAFQTTTADKRKKTYLPEGAPWLQEWHFGGPDEPGAALDLGSELGTLWLIGRVDRIDHVEGGLWITDYKTGGLANYRKYLRDDQLHHRSFQLSLYAAALRAAVPMAARSELSVQYFSLKDGRSERLEWETLRPLLAPASSVASVAPKQVAAGRPVQASLFEVAESASSAGPPPDDAGPPTLIEGLRRVVGGLREGRFAAATRGCGYCGHADACRVSRAVRDRE